MEHAASEPAIDSTRSIAVPSAEAGEMALATARRLFHRTLASWASDVLVMRGAGLSEATWGDSTRIAA